MLKGGAMPAFAASDSVAPTLINAMIPNTLHAHSAVLDQEGVILQVNDAWKAFGTENGLRLPDWGVGVNYLDLCRSALGPAHRLCVDLEALLLGRTALTTWVYPCHAPTGHRWFNLIGVRLPDSRGGAVLSHVDITDLVGQQALEDGPVTETSRPALMPMSILPRRTEDAESQRAEQTVVEGFSTRQQQVFALLREGKTDAEIATALNVSPATAKKHVEAVLRRLGVTDQAQVDPGDTKRTHSFGGLSGRRFPVRQPRSSR